MAKNIIKNNAPKKLRQIDRIILLLIIISLCALAIFQLIGNNKTLQISPDNYQYYPTADSDHGQVGLSHATLLNGNTVDCQLRLSEIAYPYCGININFEAHQDIGIDLSTYHTLYIDIDYLESPLGEDAPIRIYLRNHNPAYSRSGDYGSRKYNGISYRPYKNQGFIALPLNKFQVLSWWTEQSNLPMEHFGEEFTNTTSLELAFIHKHQPGRYYLRINDIKLQGYYIQPNHFYIGLFILWFGVLTTYLLVEYFHIKLSNERNRQKIKEIKILNKQLSKQADSAKYDELTGVLNRFGCKLWLKENMNSQQIAHCGVIFLDLDNFKAVNDTYGHSMGDKVLARFAFEMQSQLNDEICARWGGEEFIIICPNKNISETVKIAEKIRVHIAQGQWPHQQQQTCSLGVAEAHIDDLEIALSYADDMLYKAKQNGRNRTEYR